MQETRGELEMSIPFFCSVKSTVALAAPGGSGHGFMVVIAEDPCAGLRGRYSVFEISCDTSTILAVGRELPLAHARRIQRNMVKELIADGFGIEPVRVLGWGRFRKYR